MSKVGVVGSSLSRGWTLMAAAAMLASCDGRTLQPDNPQTGQAGTRGAAGTTGGAGTGGTGEGGDGPVGGTGGATVPPPSSCPSISTEIRRFNACGRTYSLAFSPDGTLLAAGMEKRRPNVHIWRLDDGALVRDIDGIGNVTYDVAFSPDGRILATVGSPGSGGDAVTPDIVKLWDVGSGALLRTLPATSGFYSSSVAFSPDGTLLATAGYVGPIEVWRVLDGALLASIPYGTSVHNLHFAPTGTRLIVGGVDRRATVWSLPAAGLMLTLSGIADEMADADFSPDGAQIASTGTNNALVLWDAISGAKLETLPGHDMYVSHVIWVGPDKLVSNDWGGTIKMWSRSGGAFSQYGELRMSGQSLGIALSPDQQIVAAGGYDASAEGFLFFRP